MEQWDEGSEIKALLRALLETVQKGAELGSAERGFAERFEAQVNRLVGWLDEREAELHELHRQLREERERGERRRRLREEREQLVRQLWAELEEHKQ